MLYSTPYTGEIPEAAKWSVMVLSLKRGRGFREIGPMEVIWKFIASIINKRLKGVLVFPNVFHGFRLGRGMGTARLEANLAHELAVMQQAPLFQIYLDF